jgi:dTDP-4-dehydrorhamnose 3,5-epimerase
MKFQGLPLSGLVMVEIERHSDERGFFAYTYSSEEFRQHNLIEPTSYSAISFNEQSLTMRGMHLQTAPHAETKLVRCTRGSIFDVAVDLRKTSPTYCQWYGTTLTEENRRGMYIPPGFAHGFLTLEDKTEVLYSIHGRHEPTAATGIRWDDPAVGIIWPDEPSIISDRDRKWNVIPKGRTLT